MTDPPVPRESKQPLVRIDDGKGINDPTAWGFCDYCAFMVAVADGRMITHRRFRNDPDDALCNGSNRDPLADIPYPAEPRQCVSMYKDEHRGRTRAHYQRRRQAARDKRDEDVEHNND